MASYNLSSEQYKRFMESMGGDYLAVDTHEGGIFRQMFLVKGEDEAEKKKAGDAALKNGSGRVAEIYEGLVNPKTKEKGYSISTEDPDAIKALQDAGAREIKHVGNASDYLKHAIPNKALAYEDREKSRRMPSMAAILSGMPGMEAGNEVYVMDAEKFEAVAKKLGYGITEVMERRSDGKSQCRVVVDDKKGNKMASGFSFVNPFTSKTETYSLIISDPRLKQEIEKMGIRPIRDEEAGRKRAEKR